MKALTIISLAGLILGMTALALVVGYKQDEIDWSNGNAARL